MRDFTRAALLSGTFLVAAISTSYAESDQVRTAQAAETLPLVRPYSVRVDSSMNLGLPFLAGATSEEQIKQLAASRGLLYQLAAQECDTIKQAFRGDCKLLNVRVNSSIQTRGPSVGEMMNVNASASYDVTIRPN